MGLTLRQFEALAAGHRAADRIAEARALATIRLAVSGTAEEIDAFLDGAGGNGGFDSAADLLREAAAQRETGA